MKTKLAGTVLTALAAGVVTAATVSNLTSDDSSRNAYSTNSKWSGGKAPANDSTKAYDFVVANGYTLWIPESSKAMTFGGASLTLGNGTTKGNISYKGENRYLTFPDVRLYGGWFGQANNKWHGIAGNATVYSTAEDPFVFSTKGVFDTYFYLKLTGGETSAIHIKANKSESPFIPFADQSATYSGSWILGNNVYFRPQTNPSNRPSGVTGQNSTSAQLFGKPLMTFNPKALVLYPGVNFRGEITSGGMNFAATDNRGIWLEAEGGTVNYTMVNGRPHHMGWPIAGKGTFALVNSGSFYLKAKCDVTLKASTASTAVYLCNGAEITENGSLEILNGGTLTLNAATDRITVNNPKLKDPTIVFAASGANLSQLRFAGNIDITGKIVLKTSSAPAATAATDVTVLVIDSAASRKFTAGDFVNQIPGATSLTVTEDPTTHDQVVSVRLVPCVTTKYATSYLDRADNWSDNATPHAGADYLQLSGHNIRCGSSQEAKDYTFACNSLTIQAGILSKHPKFTVGNLIALGGSSFNCNGYGGWGGVYQALAGSLDVRATDASPFSFNVNRSAGVLESTVTGLGRIRVAASDESDEARSFEIKGDLSGYTGNWSLFNDTNVVNNTFAFKIHSEDDLGTPSAFAANALLLGYGCVVTPQDTDVTIDDANRGVTFAAALPKGGSTRIGAAFNLAHDFTVKTPVVFQSGTFAVNGTGTFAFGAGGVTAASGVTLSVGSGAAVKPQGGDALKGVTISLADGAVLAFDAAVGAVDLTTTTLSKAGDKYLVRIDGLQSETAIATFASAQAAADFVANAKTVKGAVHKGYLFADGTTVKAGLPGAVLIFR